MVDCICSRYFFRIDYFKKTRLWVGLYTYLYFFNFSIDQYFKKDKNKDSE